MCIYCKDPNHTSDASAAMAAVSARRTVGPRRNLWSQRFRSASSSDGEKPPSGPMNMALDVVVVDGGLSPEPSASSKITD